MKYINRLTAEQESEMLKLFKFHMFKHSYSIGSEKYYEDADDCLVYHNWIADDFLMGHEFLNISDFEIKDQYHSKEDTFILRKFLYGIFKEEYKTDLKRYLELKRISAEQNANEARNKIKLELKDTDTLLGI